ncbi:nucleotide disphospho-sugar-binding domain-containing protein [Streptomyces avermitilis]|uniref:nucleotide disphospho-sugar-binding domain-containing protein n=1 Tax=Streptomyces avermitilis TaxID=33903 RepID=UPI0033E46EA6
MRVLFAVFPALAHTAPVIPLAWALRNAGHEVRVATHPDMVRPVTDAGLAAVPVGGSADLAQLADFGRNPALRDHLEGSLAVDPEHRLDWGATWYRTTRVFAGLRPMLEELTGIAVRWRPDLVLWDPFCLPAAVAARLSGAAHARLLWGQDNVAWLRQRSQRYTAQAPSGGWPDPLEEVMQQLLEPYGLPYEEELLLGQWTIDPMPPGMRLPASVRYEPMRWVPHDGGVQVPDWLHTRPARPRVCAVLGTAGRGRTAPPDGRLSAAELFASVAGLDVELFVSHHPLNAEGLVPPDRVRLLDRMPLGQVLPQCSAVIHHGGEAEFSAAAVHGVPQLIVPTPFWGEETAADYVVRRGAGLALDRAECGREPLRASLAALLRDPVFRERAAVLREELAAVPGPAQLVPVLEELTSRHQRI